jgi:hypothetical protein
MQVMGNAIGHESKYHVCPTQILVIIASKGGQGRMGKKFDQMHGRLPLMCTQTSSKPPCHWKLFNPAPFATFDTVRGLAKAKSAYFAENLLIHKTRNSMGVKLTLIELAIKGYCNCKVEKWPTPRLNDREKWKVLPCTLRKNLTLRHTISSVGRKEAMCMGPSRCTSPLLCGIWSSID